MGTTINPSWRHHLFTLFRRNLTKTDDIWYIRCFDSNISIIQQQIQIFNPYLPSPRMIIIFCSFAGCFWRRVNISGLKNVKMLRIIIKLITLVLEGKNRFIYFNILTSYIDESVFVYGYLCLCSVFKHDSSFSHILLWRIDVQFCLKPENDPLIQNI